MLVDIVLRVDVAPMAATRGHRLRKANWHIGGFGVICCVAVVLRFGTTAFVQPQYWRKIAQVRKHVACGALTEQDLTKLDRTPDELFYLLPRLGIYHVDDGFRAQLTQLYRLLVPAGGDIVDLCSQHDSHLPAEVQYNSVTIHGMNYVELLANSRATERFTQNFNMNQDLDKLADASVDAVTMTVSIQYMERPVELFKEVKRILRPGGVFIVSFSNRMFFTKAVEVWKNQKNMLGLATLVQSYFTEAGFSSVRASNGVKLPPDANPEDPFAAVIGFRVGDDAQKLPDLEQLDGVKWLPAIGAGSIW